MHHTEFTIKPNCLIIPLPSTASMYFIVHATSASFYRIDVLCQTIYGVHSGNLTRLAGKRAVNNIHECRLQTGRICIAMFVSWRETSPKIDR